MAAEADKGGAKETRDLPKILQAYSKLRLEDVHAVCELSDIGASMTLKKTLVAQLMLTVVLNKTLGRITPKVN